MPVCSLVNGKEEMNSTDQESASTSDNNANISKGAIPKRRPPPKVKKSRFNNSNNNVEVVGGKEVELNGDKTTQEPYCNCIVCERQFDRPSTSNPLDCDGNNSDDTELLSISDDGCIYTYKGDAAADLPNSFFNLEDLPPPTPEPVNRQENTSPEMDYLEMDFDPGPSGDTFSDTQSTSDVENPEVLPEDPESVNCENADSPEVVDCEIEEMENLHIKPQPSETPPMEEAPTQTVTKTKIHKLIMPWSCSIRERTKSDRKIKGIKRYHYSCSGELNSPISDYVITQDDTNCSLLNLKRAMIWSEMEAASFQVKQIGASACGATSVLNVLNALKFPLETIEEIRNAVPIRLRANESPLANYLQSRSVAGCTHQDLIDGISKLSKGQIYGRFFHMYPERVVNLQHWLQFWIGQGAVPVATLNLQKNSDPIPDAWHHQMIYGVSLHGIHLTNPLEVVDSTQLWPQLSSESILLIRREDILSRWNIRSDLKELIAIKDSVWRRMNVVGLYTLGGVANRGQVVSLIRESRRERRIGFTNTTHIKIPASYSAGITLFIRKDCAYYTLLRGCPELPLLPNDVDEDDCSDTLY